MANLLTVARKELRDSVGDKVFLVLYVLLLIMVIVIIIPGAAQHRLSLQLSLPDLKKTDPYAKLLDADSLSPSLINSLWGMKSVLSFLCPILALIISFNSVNGELEDGSLKVSLSYHLYRDQLFLGKLLGGFILMFLASFFVMLIGFAIFIYITSISVTFDLLSRIFLVSINLVIYTMIFFSLGLFFSILFKSPVKSSLLGVITWMITINGSGWSVYNRVINILAEILFGIQVDQHWGSEVAQKLGFLPSPVVKQYYDTFMSIGNLFDMNLNFGNLLKSSLTTITIQGETTSGFMVKNVYFESILPQLLVPLAVIVSIIIIVNLCSYVLFNRMEVG